MTKDDIIFLTTCVGTFGVLCSYLKFGAKYKPYCGLYDCELDVDVNRCKKCLENN